MHENGMILEVNEAPKKVGSWLVLAIQHVLAMFVACITVPLLVFQGYVNVAGDSLAHALIAPTIVSAGIGTLIYILLTKMKSPVFLASSFAYISPMMAAVSLGSQEGYIQTEAGLQLVGKVANLWTLPIGMAMVGLVYVGFALIIKFCGVKWLNKLLPTVVIGPVIMVIGLGLSGSAISNLTSASGNGEAYNLLALLSGLIAMVVTALCSHYGKGTISLIPFVLGMLAGYAFAAVVTGIGYYGFGSEYCHIVNFNPLIDNFKNLSIQSFFDLPDFLFMPTNSNFVNAQGEALKIFSPSQIGTVALLFIPVSFVTICEHIGDHKNLSGVLHRDLLENPGLTRTLMGDGLATAASGLLCGAANTTYGENVAVVGVTKIASVKVIILACIMTIILGFFSPLISLTMTIPTCVTGGVSLVLYGFIAASGVKMMINEHVDLSNSKNLYVSSVILVSGIGGLMLKFGDVSAPVITITSTAVSMFLGILMNLILKDKKKVTLPPEQKPEEQLSDSTK